MRSTRVAPALRMVASLFILAGCVTTTQDVPAPGTANVKTFGKPPPPDNALRTGITSAVQTYTPPTKAKLVDKELKPLWSAKVGQTNYRTTMALAGPHVVIGTHGGSVDGKDQADDGVYVIDGSTGQIERVIATPGGGDRDVNGIAIDGDHVFFTTDNGAVVAATLEGRILWVSTLGGEVLPAPALVDVNGDGSVDVVVGDQSGRLNAIDGRTGRKIWSRPCGIGAGTRNGFEAAAAIGDVDGDGKNDIIAGSWTGALGAFRAADGEPIWMQYGQSPLRASPVLADLDLDRSLEVLVAWSDGTTNILDGKTGGKLWATRVEEDDGDATGLLASPVPVRGPRVGALIAPTAHTGTDDGAVVLSEHLRTFHSRDGRATASPVVTRLDASADGDAIFGTMVGTIIAVDALGGHAVLGSVGGAIEASAMLADVDGDGAYELLVASNDGRLTCFATGSKERPAISRFRGDSAHNTGVIAPVNLGWSFARNRDRMLPRP